MHNVNVHNIHVYVSNHTTKYVYTLLITNSLRGGHTHTHKHVRLSGQKQFQKITDRQLKA